MSWIANAVTFSVPGVPQGKGRARIVKIGGYSRMATPQKTVAYEGLIAMAARDAMNDRPPFDGPISLTVSVRHPVPTSVSRVKREAALGGRILPTCKPDIDNVLKAIGDGCNGVVWHDDKQIARASIDRRYGVTPGLWVTANVIDPSAE